MSKIEEINSQKKLTLQQTVQVVIWQNKFFILRRRKRVPIPMKKITTVDPTVNFRSYLNKNTSSDAFSFPCLFLNADCKLIWWKKLFKQQLKKQWL